MADEVASGSDGEWMAELRFDEHPLPMAIVDAGSMRYLAVNDAASRISGVSKQDALRYSMWDNRAAVEAATLRERWARYPDRPVMFRTDLATADGLRYEAAAVTVPIVFDGRPARLSITVDETALERAASERARMTKQLVIAAQAERSRMAADLHDGPIQDLSAAALRLQGALRGELVARPGVQAALDLVREVIDGLRDVMDELHPPALVGGSLRALLEGLAARLRERSGFGLEVTMGDDVQLPEHAAASVYRIVLEAAANVGKHTGSDRMHCKVAMQGDRLLVQLADSGGGFDATAVQEAGRGLHMMRSRVEVLGGDFSIRSSPAGTVIDLTLPHLGAALGAAPRPR